MDAFLYQQWEYRTCEVAELQILIYFDSGKLFLYAELILTTFFPISLIFVGLNCTMCLHFGEVIYLYDISGWNAQPALLHFSKQNSYLTGMILIPKINSDPMFDHTKTGNYSFLSVKEKLYQYWSDHIQFSHILS
jgi:hypothetical protein